jgi:tetratricopeptide (TPR) repeat protein
LRDDDPTVAESLQGLGFVEHAKGQYTQSEKYLREAVAIYRTAYGDESLPVYQALNLMSLTVANQDRLEEAIDIQTEAIGIMNLHDGVDFQDQSIAYNNLGYVLNAADRFPEAIDAFQQAVDLTEETAAIGLLARSLANLAAVYQGLGELGKARSLHEQSLALKREWFTEEHSEIGFSLNNLAAVVSQLGEYEYAVELYTDAIENFTGTLGADHPNIFIVQANLALSYENANDHEHAIELYLQSLEGTEASGGAGTSRTLRSHIGLGRSYRSLGIMDLALHHASEAVAVGMAVNPNGVRTGLALSGFASLDNSGLTDAGRVEQFEQALSIVTIAVGSNHMDRATILLEFARYLDDTNRTERAQALFEEALVIKTRVLGPGHGDIAANQAEFEQRFGK